MIEVSTKFFTSSKVLKSLSTEESTLRGNCNFNTPQQFNLRSHESGKVCTFQLSEVQRNADNEIEAWIYKPVLNSPHAMKLVGWVVKIFND